MNVSPQLVAVNKSYAIEDEVLFKGSPELYIFLGEKWSNQHNNGRQEEYLAEFRAPMECEDSFPNDLGTFWKFSFLDSLETQKPSHS